jgi:hypothetical protein
MGIPPSPSQLLQLRANLSPRTNNRRLADKQVGEDSELTKAFHKFATRKRNADPPVLTTATTVTTTTTTTTTTKYDEMTDAAWSAYQAGDEAGAAARLEEIVAWYAAAPVRSVPPGSFTIYNDVDDIGEVMYFLGKLYLNLDPDLAVKWLRKAGYVVRYSSLSFSFWRLQHPFWRLRHGASDPCSIFSDPCSNFATPLYVSGSAPMSIYAAADKDRRSALTRIMSQVRARPPRCKGGTTATTPEQPTYIGHGSH